MTKILARLSAINFLGLLAACLLGALNFLVPAHPDWAYTVSMLHIWVSLFFVFSTLAVHCLIFIYFLGTGRWVKEVALAYRIPDDPLPRLTRELKRRTFPPALAAMLVVIAAAAAGMGAFMQVWPWPVHATVALATLTVNAWAFVIESRAVTVNAEVIEQVMHAVERIRAEQGLPTNAEALQQEHV
jgi:nucleoside recognition membrane protein YjiH